MPNYDDSRRWEVDRIGSTGVKNQTVSGRTLVSGTGEIMIPVEFPILFVEPPGFFFGGEMDGGHPIAPGFCPTISVIVAAWETLPKRGVNTGFFYSGATLGVVLTGDTAAASEQEMWVHWHFMGSAFQNPVDVLTS